MSKKSSSGNYYKVKTANWLRSDGYTVEYLEKLQRIVSKGKVIYIKRDLLESDGLATNEKEFILWNSTTKEHVAEHIKRYDKLVIPPFIQKWVIVWTPRASEPEITVVESNE